MKASSILATALLFIICTTSNAQFRGQLTLGYATATGDLGEGANGGIGFGGSFRYALSDQLDAGIEYNQNILAAEGEGIFGVTGYTAKGFYRITNSKVYPYIGLGFGLYTAENPEVTTTSGGMSTTTGGETKTSFGFSPDLGLNFGGFGIGVKYTSAGELPTSTTKVTFLRYYIGYTLSI